MRSSRRRHYRARRAAGKGSFVRTSAVQAVVPGGPRNTVATAIPRLPRMTVTGWIEPERGIAYPYRQPNGEWARAS